MVICSQTIEQKVLKLLEEKHLQHHSMYEARRLIEKAELIVPIWLKGLLTRGQNNEGSKKSKGSFLYFIIGLKSEESCLIFTI
ncbi:MAG: hypothetical protein MRT15_10945 [archaeon YNP-LCB-003-016]|nr:hypothetical protein [Candidatus Culexarchaeum yellowstonense]